MANATVSVRWRLTAIRTYWSSPFAKLSGRYQIKIWSALADSGR